MDKLREKVLHRGTADCPFQQYHLKRAHPNITLTSTHWHPEYEIIYMQTGSIELKYDKYTCNLFPGDIAFIQPEWLHSINTLKENTSYYAFVFSLELLTLPKTHFFQKNVINPIATGTHYFTPVLQNNDPLYNATKNSLQKLIQCDINAPNRKAVIFSSILEIFLTMSNSLRPCSNYIKHNNETIKMVLQYLSDHFSERISLQQISEYIHLHPNYICALFKDYTGQSIFQHLSRIRIEHAAELLKQGISVSESAARCGFDSTGFFTRKFKKQMGITPKAYSIQHR